MIFSCLVCQKEFSKSHKSKFCGSECFGKSRKGKSPWNLGKKTGIGPWRGKQRDEDTLRKIRETKALNPYSHSPETRQRISKSLRGVSRGGVSSIAMLIRGITEYKNWRAVIYERDQYTCQECGARNCELNADHIVSFAAILRAHSIVSVDDAVKCAALWDTGNGRTLCVPCHLKTPTHGHFSRGAVAA